jgi:ectoine hydroxylase-related dioxygenase (phytanoyl-CoA dioxygenase family)
LDWDREIAKNGFAKVPRVLDDTDLSHLIEDVCSAGMARSRAGIRHAMKNESVATAARDARMMEIARAILGKEAIPFRATLFDKSPVSNWLVVWHQDTALPLRVRREVAGWGPWSVKDGVNYAHAPASALEQVLALRLHLDDSDADNGPLRVLPGTHGLGVLSDEQLHELSTKVEAEDCLVRRGGVLAMRPLIVHASSKSHSEKPRRVLHIEYASSEIVEDRLELAIS